MQSKQAAAAWGVCGRGQAAPVTRFATQVARLVVLEGAIQGRQLPELHPLVLIPGLICGHQQILDHLCCIIHLHHKKLW